MKHEQKNEAIPVEIDITGNEGVRNYEESRKQAEILVNNPDQLEKLLFKLEEKLKSVPKVGEWLSTIPILISMVRSYVRKEYTMLPILTIIGIVAALVYFVSPVDIIPDSIPVIGMLDDALVLKVTLSFVKTDVEAYKDWQKEQEKTNCDDVNCKKERASEMP